MTDQQIIELLNQLKEAQAKLAVLQMDKERARDGVLTPEIRQALADIDTEFLPLLDAAVGATNDLATAIKTGVLNAGHSVKGETLHAVFAKGRVSWDTKALDGYAAAHPELAAFRKESEPSVSIRGV